MRDHQAPSSVARRIKSVVQGSRWGDLMDLGDGLGRLQFPDNLARLDMKSLMKHLQVSSKPIVSSIDDRP